MEAPEGENNKNNIDSDSNSSSGTNVQRGNNSERLIREERLQRLQTAIQSRIRHFSRALSEQRSSSRSLLALSDIPSSRSQADLNTKASVFPTPQMVPSPSTNAQLSETASADAAELSTNKSDNHEGSSILPFENPNSDAKSIVEFPNEILYKIFKYLTFETISKKRMVCSFYN